MSEKISSEKSSDVIYTLNVRWVEYVLALCVS